MASAPLPLAESYRVLLDRNAMQREPDEVALYELACEALTARVTPEELIAWHRAALRNNHDVPGAEALLVKFLDAYDGLLQGLREEIIALPEMRSDLSAAARIAEGLRARAFATAEPLSLTLSQRLLTDGSYVDLRDISPGRVYAAVGTHAATGILAAQVLALMQYGARALLLAGTPLDRLAEYLDERLALSYPDGPRVDFAAVVLNVETRTCEVFTAGTMRVIAVGEPPRMTSLGYGPLGERFGRPQTKQISLNEGEALLLAPDQAPLRSNWEFERSVALMLSFNT